MAMNPRLLRPRASGGFDPRTLSGLNLWIDFSDSSTLTLDENSLIQQATDKSNSANTGTQGTAANRPALGTIGTKQAADWGTATNTKSVALDTLDIKNWREVYIAAKWEGGSSFPTYNGLFTGTTGSNGDIGFVGNQGAFTFYNISWFATLYLNGDTSGVAMNTSPVVLPTIASAFVMRGVASSDVTVRGFRIGGERNSSSRGWLGKIGEVLSFNRALTATESASVTQYLKKKWGV